MVIPLREDGDLGVEPADVLVEQVVAVAAPELVEGLGDLGGGLGDEVLPGRAVVERDLGGDRVVGVDVVAAVEEEVGPGAADRLEDPHPARAPGRSRTPGRRRRRPRRTGRRPGRRAGSGTAPRRGRSATSASPGPGRSRGRSPAGPAAGRSGRPWRRSRPPGARRGRRRPGVAERAGGGSTRRPSATAGRSATRPPPTLPPTSPAATPWVIAGRSPSERITAGASWATGPAPEAAEAARIESEGPAGDHGWAFRRGSARGRPAGPDHDNPPGRPGSATRPRFLDADPAVGGRADAGPPVDYRGPVSGRRLNPRACRGTASADRPDGPLPFAAGPGQGLGTWVSWWRSWRWRSPTSATTAGPSRS